MKEVLITSSVLIVVLLILRAVFAKKVRRTLIYGAWALVALRLLIPVQIGHLPFSVLNLFQPATETVTQVLDTPVVGKTEQDAYQQVLQDYVQDYIEKEQLEEPFEQPVFTPEVQDHIQSALDQELPKEDIVGSIEKDYAQQEVYVPEVQPQVQQKVEESTDAVTLGQIAAGVWLVGMVVVAIWLAVGNLTIVRSLKRSAKVLAWDSPIPVYVSQKAVSPCLVGLFRPKIYVTPECAEDETVSCLCLFDDFIADIVVENALAELAACTAGDTVAELTVAEPDDFCVDAVCIKCFLNFAKTGVSTALFVWTAVDEQNFHGYISFRNLDF